MTGCTYNFEYIILVLQLDDQKEKDEDEELMKELELLDDDFLKEYQQRRLEEMRKLFRVCHVVLSDQ